VVLLGIDAIGIHEGSSTWKRGEMMLQRHRRTGDTRRLFGLDRKLPPWFPLLITLVMGIISFGQAFGTYQTLTNAAAAGGAALAVARGQSTNPCVTAAGPIISTATYLNQNNILVTITATPQTGQTGSTYTFATAAPANTTSCASEASTMLAIQNYNITVLLTYPVQFSIFGINFMPSGSKLTAEAWEVVQ
jgi:hypothetical protein